MPVGARRCVMLLPSPIRHTPVMQGGFPFASSITSEGSMTDIAAPLHGSARLGASDKPKLDTPPQIRWH